MRRGLKPGVLGALICGVIAAAKTCRECHRVPDLGEVFSEAPRTTETRLDATEEYLCPGCTT